MPFRQQVLVALYQVVIFIAQGQFARFINEISLVNF